MAFSLSPDFLKSAQKATQFPADSGREVAFAGRSNSGKSTALNAITARRRLARTSKTPGRTQLINFFALEETCRLVDLPGYGYAKVAEAVRRQWRVLLEDYFRDRRSLSGLFITVDVRRGLNDLDQVMLSWSRAAKVPAAVLLTKADKLSRNAARQRQRQIASTVPEDVPLILFSAPGHQGLEQARELLLAWLDKTDDKAR